MTREEFESKALNVLTKQKFENLPLFEGENLEDFEVSDESGSIGFEVFVGEFFNEIKGYFKGN